MAFALDLKSTVQKLGSDALAIGEATIYLSSITRPGISSEKYLSHFKAVSDDVKQRFRSLTEASAEDDLQTRLAALKHVLSDKYGYVLAAKELEVVQRCDMTCVIDSGAGEDILLVILYIIAARSQGWEAQGIDFPGRFLCVLSNGGQRLIFDPSQSCKIMQAPDLRVILKSVDSTLEMSATYYDSVEDKDVLITLQNRIKNRQIEIEDYEGAVKSVEAMRLIDPKEYRLLLEAGVLYMRTDQHGKARPALEKYIKLAPATRDRQEALAIMQHLNVEDNSE